VATNEDITNANASHRLPHTHTGARALTRAIESRPPHSSTIITVTQLAKKKSHSNYELYLDHSLS
jgi:hypothetical protein